METQFGVFAPNKLLSRLIRTAQNAPNNWWGKQYAQMIKKVFNLLKYKAVDFDVRSIKMRFHLDDNVSERNFLFLPWRYDTDELLLIEQKMPENGVFLDIGANAGIYTLWAAKNMDGNGHIVAFEPNPVMLERLKYNCYVNRAYFEPNIKLSIIDKAVSDKDESACIYIRNNNLGSATLLENDSLSNEEGIKIRSVLLADALIDLKIDKVDILKIDVEGAEDRALIPFLTNVEKSLYPKFIIMENSSDYWEKDLTKTLANAEYSLIKTTRKNLVYQLEI